MRRSLKIRQTLQNKESPVQRKRLLKLLKL